MNLHDSQFFVLPKKIPNDAQIIFVADLFVEDYVGGAELTTEALIKSSPLKVHKLKSAEVSMELLKQGKDKFWIFGNFSQLNPQLFPAIVSNLKYSILEYDFKYCKYRSPEKHLAIEHKNCDCDNQITGKMISAFYYGSMGLWWMSEKQKQKYLSLFPFLAEKDNIVLSSVFDNETLGKIKLLRETNSSTEKRGWIVLGSDSWIKGANAAKNWCVSNNLEHEVVWNIKYEELLAKLSCAEGFVYLPEGGDTCPRMCIEAKLLGCKLHMNDYVLHASEEWFATDDIQSIEEYLYASKEIFWNGIQKMIDYKPRISGYITTYNCVQQQYPFIESIKSMLQFCDEVCVVDGGSQDGTLDELIRLRYPTLLNEPPEAPTEFALINHIISTGFPEKVSFDELGFNFSVEADNRIKIKIVKRDWTHPRFAVFDGMQKAEARKMCTGDYCWQMDSDEIVHEDDACKIHSLVKMLPLEIDILSLPVVEYWGGYDKVRCDIFPWKWRLSRNKPNITHGIPKVLRRYDENGDLYSSPGSDGCDLIDVTTFEPLPHVSFYSQEADSVRRSALSGDFNAVNAYQNWFNEVIENIPGVYHYSWFDIERKIRLYRYYWQSHWRSLHNQEISDIAENNMFFDLPWNQVTDQMIKDKAIELSQKTGGHIFHTKWKGGYTPHLRIRRKPPTLMKSYAVQNA